MAVDSEESAIHILHLEFAMAVDRAFRSAYRHLLSSVLLPLCYIRQRCSMFKENHICHKKGNLRQCQSYRTISLIRHPSKVMLKIILNRLKPQVKIIAEEQAGFRAGRSTTEQICNLRILCETYFQHQQDLYYVFIDFKKAFDRVWHPALWASMRKYIISTNLIQVIKNLYKKATSAVLFNSSIGD